LESRGHEVYRYTLHNDAIKHANPLALTQATLWNGSIYRELRSLIREQQFDVAHFHNTFPLISPSAYYAARDEGVPVVQTLHNYRLLCPNALFFRNGQVCEDCLGKAIYLPGIFHGCYRGSKTASAGVAAMVHLHTLIGTWTNVVDVFIAYSHFALNKFVEGGLPAHKLEFKTNFLHPAPDPGQGQGGYAVFVGRLSVEKGIGVMLAAWEKLGGRIPLKILGDGPLAGQVEAAAARTPGIEWLGRKPLEEVYQIVGDAAFLVFPSEWYETFGRVAIEAFAKGTPVVAAKIGAIAELVEHGRTGFHFRPSDPSHLAEQVEWLLHHPEQLSQMRQAARAEFEAKYTADQNYQRLMEIYDLVLGQTGTQPQIISDNHQV